jgi:Xaa-Pro aminopeptidase
MSESGLPFSLAEYRERLARARQAVAARDLDAALVTIPENILYLCGHDTLGYFAFQVIGIPQAGEPFIFLREIEADHIMGTGLIRDVVTYGDRENPTAAFVAALKARGLQGKKIGIERDAWFQPVGRVEGMQSLLGQPFGDATGLVEGLRMLKSDREIELIRQAARAADQGMRAGIAAARAGVPEAEVAAAIYSGLLGAGSDYVGPVYVMSGENSALAHSPWTSRRMKTGDVVYIELAGCVHRYHAALRRTLTIGKPSADVKRAHDACRSSRTLIQDLLRPGKRSQDIHDAHDVLLQAEGIRDFLRMKTGYSIGIGYPPGWGEWHIMDLKADDPRPVLPRMSLHMGTQLVFRGRYGIGLSDTVITGEGAPEVLTSIEPELFEV